MPGIAGIISRRPAAECQSLVKTMLAVMEHETFYKSGAYFAPPMGIYCGWVAPEVSFAEGGVHFNEQSDVALIISGEVFLDAEVGTALKQKGHQLDDCKANWLVHLYEEESDAFFTQLNGLFSGLLLDKRQGKAFLFNDRFGIERIYFHEAGATLYFASEAKALLRILPELREFDPEGVTDFLTFGCTLDWRTLFRGIQILPGGSLWTFENGECRNGKYFSSETWESQPPLSVEDFESEFQETFKRILSRYFESESKIGIALTGGLDTRMIMACRPQIGRNQTTYTFSGTNGWTLDDKIAARIADASGLEHQLLRLNPDFFSNFGAHADKTVFVTDGGCGISGAHEIYFNRQARALAPVRLTGNYGSEILRGISTFKPVPLAAQLLNPDIAKPVNNSAPRLARHKSHLMTFAAFKEIPWNLSGTLAAGRSQVGFRTPYLDNDLVALAYQAPACNRKSPLPSLRLIKANSAAMSAIPTDRGFIGDQSGLGSIFRRAFAEVTFKIDYYNNEGLPRVASALDSIFKGVTSQLGVVGLHKFLHYPSWFRNELADYMKDRLASPQVQHSQFWNPDFVQRMADEHISDRQSYGPEINVVLTLEAVERLLFRELPRGF